MMILEWVFGEKIKTLSPEIQIYQATRVAENTL